MEWIRDMFSFGSANPVPQARRPRMRAAAARAQKAKVAATTPKENKETKNSERDKAAEETKATAVSNDAEVDEDHSEKKVNNALKEFESDISPLLADEEVRPSVHGIIAIHVKEATQLLMPGVAGDRVVSLIIHTIPMK